MLTIWRERELETGKEVDVEVSEHQRHQTANAPAAATRPNPTNAWPYTRGEERRGEEKERQPAKQAQSLLGQGPSHHTQPKHCAARGNDTGHCT